MKKLISVLLAIVMLFTITIPALAAQKTVAASENYDGNPVVIVRGIDFAGLTYENGEKALNVSASTIFSALMDGFMGMLKLKKVDSVLDGAFLAAKEVFDPISCDKEGNSKYYDVSMKQYPESMASYPEFVASLPDGGEEGIVKTAVDKYGAENTYFFTYDWRKTPEQIADELHSLIGTARRNSGKDKVNIICASMGGMVTTAYFYYYGTYNVESAVFLSGAQNGTYVCGDALNGRIVFDGDVLVKFINGATGDNVFLKIFIGIFDMLGVVDFIANIANDMVSESFDRGNDLMLRDSLGAFCGFWALCPDEDFESGVENIFGGHEEDYPVLLDKIDGVKDFVFSTEDTLSKAMADGVKISFVSNYNSGLVPVYEKANLNGDNVLEAELTSNFATIAPLGETLSKGYIENADPKYISPDNVIDASTAVFKDNTWFVKDAPHVAADYRTGFSEFTFTLLESETQPTINSFEKYPQFMIADEFLFVSPLK
ncbi:MAG: hypothetical protein E7529_01630 [Ruminococcaceae bacterium]|nr:hypothetical protein [Oscillospiraceae bacterium]